MVEEGGSWVSGQPMPMLNRPVVISITQVELVSKYFTEGMLWYWGADPKCVGNKMRTMRCNELGTEPEGNEAELLDWISRYGSQSTLLVDCRESIGMPLTVTPLLELLVNMPCPVLAV
ncbi:MAG: hypothetical protein CMQ51_02205, partial [Gammaproteobacteria bacterium]|nr:hypothetical protein [Gammaproteobacteria bacterium]